MLLQVLFENILALSYKPEAGMENLLIVLLYMHLWTFMLYLIVLWRQGIFCYVWGGFCLVSLVWLLLVLGGFLGFGLVFSGFFVLVFCLFCF